MNEHLVSLWFEWKALDDVFDWKVIRNRCFINNWNAKTIWDQTEDCYEFQHQSIKIKRISPSQNIGSLTNNFSQHSPEKILSSQGKCLLGQAFANRTIYGVVQFNLPQNIFSTRKCFAKYIVFGEQGGGRIEFHSPGWLPPNLPHFPSPLDRMGMINFSCSHIAPGIS